MASLPLECTTECPPLINAASVAITAAAPVCGVSPLEIAKRIGERNGTRRAINQPCGFTSGHPIRHIEVCRFVGCHKIVEADTTHGQERNAISVDGCIARQKARI